MKRRGGYVLLGLLLFFTVLGLSGTVAVLEQDTRLIRLSEEELKLNLNALRRGIDLFRYRYPNGLKREQFDELLRKATDTAGIANFTNELAKESFIRSRAATVKVNRHKREIEWKIIENLIKNPSFEIDDGKVYEDTDLDGWHGNHTANDGIPDGWKLKAGGAEQKIKINETGYYVISFWARSENPSAKVILTVKVDNSEVLKLIANSTEWKRFFRDFEAVPAISPIVSIELSQEGTNSGDATFIDGLMLEKWKGTGDVRVPSAWTDIYQIIPNATDSALQERSFKTELLPDPNITNIATYSHRWFQW